MIAGLIKRRATVLLVVICVAVFGWKAYVSLPREAAPDVEIPFVMVTTAYIGVSPEDIETLVTQPIENEIAGLKDLKKLSSTSAEGASIISLEFEPEVIIEDALQRVRDRVDRAKPKLPEDIEDPEIREVSFSDWPIVIITIAGDVDEVQLKNIAEDFQDDAKRISGVLDATLSGGREREIRVQIDPVRLAHYGLSLNDVIGAISDENVNIPGGNVTAGDSSVLLRVPGDVEDPSELEDVAIKRVGDRAVFVRDVGRVLDDFEDRESYARMNGQTAVSIGITKRSGANILELVNKIKVLAKKHSKRWPKGVSYRALADQSRNIEDMVADLENGIITALLLVVLVLFFFMGVRNSFLVALAIPLSMLMGILLIWAFGMTLNMVVLFSLILVLGMLVDNAIVLVENIYRHLELGKSRFDAAVIGTQEVAVAVAASTATTVAAFFPLVFWQGIMGQFMGFLPKTVIIVLISSLAVAIGVLPVVAARYMRRTSSEKSVENKKPSRTLQLYKNALLWSIEHRWLSTLCGTALLIVTFVIYGIFNHGTEFFPETEPNRATISIRAPDGTDVEATDRLVRQVEEILAEEENVEIFVAETGVSGGGDPLAGAQAVPYEAKITLDFLPDATTARKGQHIRVENTGLTIERLRNKISMITGAEIKIEKEREGPPVGKPVVVEVSGEDFHELGEFAAKFRRTMQNIPGVTDITDDYRVGRPEMRLRIDRGAAKEVGASTNAIASTVRTAVAGTKASVFRDGEDEYDIMVEVTPEHRRDLQSVLGLRIPGREDKSPETFPVPLSAVASYTLAGGSGAIRHVDQKRVVTISADVAEGYNENAVRAAVQNAMNKAKTPSKLSLRLGGADDEQRESQEFLATAFLVALFLILLVLVSQFNRFDLPLIILFTVVLSLIGVLWGLLLTGTPFGVIMTGLGVISLAGVVVNNAIVLLEYVQQLQDEGMEVKESLLEAGLIRFRPVMLTAATTILGLVPMALGISFDFRAFRLIVGSSTSQWWGPMAVAVIFGLAFATILTLVMVPTLYCLFEDFRAFRIKWAAKLFKNRSLQGKTT
ncbi:MAG: efflux RND transporter permease subunit [Myxococcales bacterium]|nr:MAG: efflux RND transporter permease subunit [Myxococcales bacterium]